MCTLEHPDPVRSPTDITGFPLPLACQLFKEFHEDNTNIVLDQTELNHTVNIFNCKNCTIQIRGKINAVQVGEWHTFTFRTLTKD